MLRRHGGRNFRFGFPYRTLYTQPPPLVPALGAFHPAVTPMAGGEGASSVSARYKKTASTLKHAIFQTSCRPSLLPSTCFLPCCPRPIKSAGATPDPSQNRSEHSQLRKRHSRTDLRGAPKP